MQSNPICRYSLIVALCFAAVGSALAQSSYPYISMKAEEPDKRREMTVLIPYALSSESLGFTLGLAWVTTENLAAPASLFSTIFYSENDSAMFMAGARNVHVRGTDRFFLDATILTGRRRGQQVYVDYTPEPMSTRAGSNYSDADDYIVEDTWEARADLFLKWVLPIGEGADEPVEKYLVSKGLLASEASGGSWLPWESGRTTASIRPQYWDQFIDPENDDLAFRTLNVAFNIEYDNCDFRPNPSRGGYLRAGVTHDWGALSDTHAWTTIEGEARKFFWLGRSSWARHQVIALNASTMNTPSWEESIDADGNVTAEGVPPHFAGATLGGMNQMKAYPRNRFHDKAAMHYAAEYRFIPNATLFPRISMMRMLDIQWWQFVVLGELGRVAPEWDIKTLHEDMKWDAGLGVRAMFGAAVGRMDFMYGEEGFALQAMFGQSF